MTEPVRYGLIGCGGFARFCLSYYRDLPEVRCAAVADDETARAASFAAEFGLAASSPEALLADPAIDLVHIATPPATHSALASTALRAGKHVLCEKPLAVRLPDARNLIELSRATGRLLAVNLIMRYNPLCAAVKRIIELGSLGMPLHAHFINDAKDETLPQEHWFWDHAQSGGIFIEHGVHFFDLFAWWFGSGRAIGAQQVRRGDGRVDQAQGVVLYDDSVLATFYHGFHQATRMERQDWKLVFELGNISLQEWIPTALQLEFLGGEQTLEELCAVLPGCTAERRELYRGSDRFLHSRGRARQVDGRFLLSLRAGLPKMPLYGKMLCDLLADQLAATRNPSHFRRVTEANGYDSLAMATELQRLADGNISAG